ncbi:MAG: Alpha,alpha-trehalose-phosphate synthase [UDP-forming] [uncultured Thermomicrobiales bacterium]|uniref:Alpha,alpha-trehalose-phosphate synthase [UDP-forming] n=1 Tax=uncultured Thermomicrobiales bacterium TaxID=1645740 RepID=A0A6J4UNP0_9BACT|nr:MAG: Alpha,alpha-trehalose-phosphate synthase [UDP-forming] [uncultured Thermomicrobiales bacterium]
MASSPTPVPPPSPSGARPGPEDGRVAGRTLIVASNRGPVTFSVDENGQFTSRKGSGGVVTAVSAIARDRQPIWIAAAMTEGDRARAALAQERGEGLISPVGEKPEFRLRFVVPDAASYRRYYNEISNPLLWFLQHYLWDTPRSPDITAETWTAWNEGYVVVNRLFADEILAACDQVADEPIIMLQDYHLYLCPGFIRERRPGAILQHFVHIPWPDPDYWRLLPLAMRRAILEGMLGNDVIGFQTPAHARSFMYTCEAYVPGVQVDYGDCGVRYQGRRIEVRSYPISIDTATVRRSAYGKDARSHDRYLPNHWNEFTVLRVDRAEPSKNIVRGFQAFDRFLEAHPDFQGRINFVAITVPSRMDVEEYRDYLDDVSAVVGRINARYANVETGWQPIHMIMGENYPRALAAMKWYDVLLVNSIIDGMNLVAKEGALLNERNGVLILSEGAGAAIQLGDDALMVAPADVEGTAQAIYEAVTMPLSERRRRADRLRRIVEQDDVASWFRQQLEDIEQFVLRPRHERLTGSPSGASADLGMVGAISASPED